MKSNRLIPLLWVFPLAITTLACPTRTVPAEGSDGMAGTGGDVDSGSDRGGASGAGGNGGVGGASGRGGASGVSGAGGLSGAGGAGGASGSGVVSGSAGVGGNAGSTCTSTACPGNFGCLSATTCATTCAARSTAGCAPGYECVNNGCSVATVPCGSTLCQVGEGEECCVSGTPSSPVYTCSTSGSCGSFLDCDSEVDCPSGQICCGTTNGVTFATSCTAPPSCKGGTTFGAFQICDPSLSAPAECLTGGCTGTFSLDPALHTCQ
jgi:hypothetical protein